MRGDEVEILAAAVQHVAAHPERHPQGPGGADRQIEHADDDERQHRAGEPHHRQRRQIVAAHAHAPGTAVGAPVVGIAHAQADQGQVRHRERQHRAKRVDLAEEVRLAGEQREAGEAGEHEDPDVRRAVAAMQAAHRVGQLAVHPHRVRQPRDAEHARVRGGHEDRDGEDADVEQDGVLKRAELHPRDDPDDRVVREAAVLRPDAEQRAALAVLALDRQRRQRDQRQGEVDREDGDHHALDRRRDRVVRVARLAGHVRDRLDARVRDGADRDRQQELGQGRRLAEERQVVDEDPRVEDQRDAEAHDRQLAAEVDHGEDEVDADRVLDAAHVDECQQRDDDRRQHDVPRRLLEAFPREAPGIVRREERRDGDRDDVVEHLRPGREERPQLVERAPGEQRRAARLGIHRGRLGVCRGGAVEERSRDQEDERREARRERRDEPQRVVDRRADVAVRRREERVDPEHALQSVELALCHPRRESTLGTAGLSRARASALARREHYSSSTNSSTASSVTS